MSKSFEIAEPIREATGRAMCRRCEVKSEVLDLDLEIQHIERQLKTWRTQFENLEETLKIQTEEAETLFGEQRKVIEISIGRNRTEQMRLEALINKTERDKLKKILGKKEVEEQKTRLKREQVKMMLEIELWKRVSRLEEERKNEIKREGERRMIAISRLRQMVEDEEQRRRAKEAEYVLKIEQIELLTIEIRKHEQREAQNFKISIEIEQKIKDLQTKKEKETTLRKIRESEYQKRRTQIEEMILEIQIEIQRREKAEEKEIQMMQKIEEIEIRRESERQILLKLKETETERETIT